jgi:glyoxylase-like metal-dependent hydrolase (beta-lactamase superfamily II)
VSTLATLDPRLLAPRERGMELIRADEVGCGLWSLRLPLAYPRTRSVNVYLLDAGTLLDCGSAVGAGWEALDAALRRAGSRPADIRTLVLSHLHPDHASLAGELVERIGCEVVRLEGPDTNIDRLRESTIDRAERHRLGHAHGIPAADLEVMADAPLADDGLQPRPPADALLRAGDVVAGWQVVPAPGHSPNQLALWDGRRVIGADVAYPEVFPYLEWGHTPDPLAEYLATLDRIEALQPRRYFSGHGAPDDDPAPRFASARAAIARMAATVGEALDEGPASAYEITCRLTGHDPDPEPRQTWMSRVLCVLEHLPLQCETGGDGVRRWSR